MQQSGICRLSLKLWQQHSSFRGSNLNESCKAVQLRKHSSHCIRGSAASPALLRYDSAMANLRPQFISAACRAPAVLDPGAPCPACQLLPATFWLDTRAITLLLPAGVDIFSAGAHNPAPAKERRSPAICPMTLCRRLTWSKKCLLQLRLLSMELHHDVQA